MAAGCSGKYFLLAMKQKWNQMRTTVIMSQVFFVVSSYDMYEFECIFSDR